MAHLVPHGGAGGGGSYGGYPNTVPVIVNKFINQSIDDDEPLAESDDGNNIGRARKKKKTEIVGDVRLVHREFTRLRIAEFSNAYLGMIGLGICIIEREMRHEYGSSSNDGIRIGLLTINLATTICLLISLYFSYTLHFNWMKARGFLSKYDNLINTGMYKMLIVECIVCFISPLPFIYDEKFEEYNINFKTHIDHWYNDLLLAWSFIRIYLILRCVLANSFFMSPRAQRVCQMNGCYASYMFAIKCAMKDQPYLVLMTNLVASLFYFGYLIRLFDQDLSGTTGQNFNSITNPVWLSIVTMTTVGYGDFFPKSLPSRIAGLLCSFYGVYLVSLFVIALENLLVFDQSEERSYELISRLEDKEALKLEAVNVLTSAFKHRQAKQMYPDKKAFILSKLKNFRKYLMNFQKIAKAIRGNYGMDTPSDRVRREINELRESIDDLKKSLALISEHFGVEMVETKGSSNMNKDGSNDDEKSKLK